MNTAYRTERARLRDYLTAMLDAVDGCHRAMAHAELTDAARYADDLRVLGSCVQRSVDRIRNIVEGRVFEQTNSAAPGTERSAQ